MKISKRKKRLIVVLFIMAVIFSVCAFCVPFKKNGTFWTAYTAEILAFLLQIPVFKIISKNGAKLKSKLLGIPLFTVGYMYLGIQTIVSIMLLALNTIFEPFHIGISIAVCAIILAAAVICGNAASIPNEGYTHRAGNSIMKTLCMKADNITLKARDDNSRNMLNLVAESIRYSSPDSSKDTREIELRLKNILAQLDKAVSEGNDIVELCAEIAQLLNTRNDICKAAEQ